MDESPLISEKEMKERIRYSCPPQSSESEVKHLVSHFWVLSGQQQPSHLESRDVPLLSSERLLKRIAKQVTASRINL
jgi:hypothetical protein